MTSFLIIETKMLLRKMLFIACGLMLTISTTGCFLLVKPAVKVTKATVKTTGKVVKTVTSPITK
jgi:hypothetical protein